MTTRLAIAAFLVMASAAGVSAQVPTADWQTFLTKNVVTTGNLTMPLSFQFPKDHFADISDASQSERVMSYAGIDIYDGACWMMAMGLLSETSSLQAFTRVLLNHKNFSGGSMQAIMNGSPDVQVPNNDPSYNYKSLSNYYYYGYNAVIPVDPVTPTGGLPAAFSSENAYDYRYVAPYYCAPDPDATGSPCTSGSRAENIKCCGVTSGSCPKGCVGWPDWRVITGEAAWAQMLAPVQAMAMMNMMPPSLDNPFMQMALDLVPAIEAMQSPVGGIFYKAIAPLSASPFSLATVISNENNFSTYGALSVLKAALQSVNGDQEATKWIQRIDNILSAGYCYDYANGRPLLNPSDWTNKPSSGVTADGECDGSIPNTITHPSIEYYLKHYGLAYVDVEDSVDPFFFTGGNVAALPKVVNPYRPQDFAFTPAVSDATLGYAIGFATDVQTWGLSVLGLTKLHELYSGQYDYRGVGNVTFGTGASKTVVNLSPDADAIPDSDYRLAYRIWNTARKYAGYFGPEYAMQNPPGTNNPAPQTANLGTPVMGVGYTRLGALYDRTRVQNYNNSVASPEWSWGAVNMLRLISEQYAAQRKPDDWLRIRNQMGVDAMSIESGLLHAPLYVCDDADSNHLCTMTVNATISGAAAGTAMKYANVRYLIPFGWYSNPIASLTATSWAVMMAKNFNPFGLYGTAAATSKLTGSGPLTQQTTVTVVNNVGHEVAVNSRPLDAAACTAAGGTPNTAYGGYCELAAAKHIPVGGSALFNLPAGATKIEIPYAPNWGIACTLDQDQLAYLSANPGEHAGSTYTIRAIWTPASGTGACVL